MADDTTPRAKVIKDEIATAAKDIDIFAGWLTRLENPDPVLRSEAGGKGLKLYDEVARDAHAASVLQTRYLAVVGKEWEVLPPETGAKRADKRNQEIADFVKAALAASSFDQWRQELLQGILYGFYSAEVIWGISDLKSQSSNSLVPVRVYAKHPRRFVFTPDRELRLLTPGNMVDGEALPPRKFLVFTYGSSDNPYGCGLGQKLWFPVWFKRHGVKYWMIFLDKFGMPTTVGKYPPGTDPDQQKKLLEALKAIQTDTAVKVPNTMEIALLEAARTGQASHEGLCDFMDRQISKAVLGQTLTTEVKGEGSYAASQTHDEVRGDIVKADADLLCECLNNSLVRWIVDFNFPGVTEYPKLWIRCEEEENLKPLAERDKILVQDVGLPIPKRYFYETYALPEPEGGEETVGGAKPTPEIADPGPEGGGKKDENGRKTNGEAGKRGEREFGDAGVPAEGKKPRKSSLMQSFTPDQRAIEGLKRAVEPELQAAAAGYVDAVRAAIEDAADFEEAKGRLMAAYAEMDDAAAADLLARSLFAADAWGRING